MLNPKRHKMLLNGLAIILVIQSALAASSNEPELGSDGRPLAKAATFHFPEYAYKETSKNVSRSPSLRCHGVCTSVCALFIN